MTKPFEKGFQREYVENIQKNPPVPSGKKSGCVKTAIIIIVIIILIVGYMYIQGK